MNAECSYTLFQYEQYRTEIGYNLDTGRVSAVLGYLYYDPRESKEVAIADWKYLGTPIIKWTDKSFRMIVPLERFFGILNDYGESLEVNNYAIGQSSKW